MGLFDKETDTKRVVVRTSRGLEVECLPIAVTLDIVDENIKKQFTFPAVPMRKVFGPPEPPPSGPPAWVHDIPLTEAFIATSEATPEQKEEWELYAAEHNRIEAELDAKRNNARIRLIVLRGINVLNRPGEDEWVREQEYIGAIVPTDKHERAEYFFRTEVIGTADDTTNIMLGILRASGMDEEVVKRLEDSFRNKVGGDERADAGPDTGDTELQAQDGQVGLVE